MDPADLATPTADSRDCCGLWLCPHTGRPLRIPLNNSTAKVVSDQVRGLHTIIHTLSIFDIMYNITCQQHATCDVVVDMDLDMARKCLIRGVPRAFTVLAMKRSVCCVQYVLRAICAA